MNGFFDRLSREPVLIGVALLATHKWLYPAASTEANLAMLGWVAVYQKMFSTSKKTAEENIEVAKYVGAVEHQNVANAGLALAQAERLTKPRIKVVGH